MSKVEFLMINGFPKCGTTSLFDWLDQTDVFNSSCPKETHFFNDIDDWKSTAINVHNQPLKSFYNYFHEDMKGTYLEASTRYLYQKYSARMIKNQIGNIKSIICVRDPIDRIISNYGYFKNNKDILSKDLSLDEYVNKMLSSSRITGINQIDNALEEGIYINYLNKWAETFGKENIYIVALEEIDRDAKSVVIDILNWLEIDANLAEKISFKSKNATYDTRFYLVHKICKYIQNIIPNSKSLDFLKSIYEMINVKKTAKSELMSEDLISSIKKYYSPSVSSLIDFVDRPLPFKNFTNENISSRQIR